MANRIVFDRSGTREKDPKHAPPDCNSCQYAEGTSTRPGLWDTPHDVENFFNITRTQALVEVWAALWRDFECFPDDKSKSCKTRQACSAKPTFIEAFAELVRDPDSNLRWRLYVTLGRKIRCVEEADGKDARPEIPAVEKPKEEEPPKKEKGTGVPPQK